MFAASVAASTFSISSSSSSSSLSSASPSFFFLFFFVFFLKPSAPSSSSSSFPPSSLLGEVVFLRPFLCCCWCCCCSLVANTATAVCQSFAVGINGKHACDTLCVSSYSLMFGPSSDVSSLREKKKIKKKEREMSGIIFSCKKYEREESPREKKKLCVTVQ